jgi:hypothetical protein
VANIMTQACRLNKILVQPQVPAQGPGHPGDQLDVEDPVGQVVVLYQGKDLGLVNVPGKGKGIQDPVRVRGKGLAVFGLGVFFLFSPYCAAGGAGQGGKDLLFLAVQALL